MGARGPKSSAELAIVGATEVLPRPHPPSELTAEQADEWVAITSSLPADWFTRETHGLLTQYCRHVVGARHVAQLIDALESSDDDLDLGKYEALLKMQEREGRAMSSLATRMRITQQATYHPEKSKGKPSPSRKPWQSD